MPAILPSVRSTGVEGVDASVLPEEEPDEVFDPAPAPGHGSCYVVPDLVIRERAPGLSHAPGRVTARAVAPVVDPPGPAKAEPEDAVWTPGEAIVPKASRDLVEDVPC